MVDRDAGPIKSAPAVVGDAMFIVAGDGHVVSLDPATGKQRWTTVDGGYIGTLTATAGRIIAVGIDGGLSALGIADGARQWNVAGSILPNHNPLAVGDLVLAGGGDLRLHAYDVATGTERWSASTGGPLGRSASSDGSTVYIGSDEGVLHAFAAASGTVLWTESLASGE